MSGVLGVYVHIPFCCSKCDYCDFYSLAGSEQWMDQYQKALIAQIKMMATRMRGYQVDTIYFGGGTPSYYGEKRLREVLVALRRHLSVCRSPEITLECNPESVDKKSMMRLRRAGFNRISLGMQSADDVQLQDLHRPHNFAQVVEAVKMIREAKIENVSLDLIYGLPGQTMEGWQDTLEKAIALEPEHFSGYGLKVEEGTHLASRVERGEQLPDDDLQADMYLYMTSRLKSAGYRQYEISNFAKTGRESRHNLKYWMGREYVGFGPGAHSDFAGSRFACQRNLEGYMEGILRGDSMIEDAREISKAERAQEYLMLRLRTRRGIEEWEYRREFTLNFEPIQRKLELFEARGLAVQSGHRWSLTPQGSLVSNAIIGELLDVQGALPSELIQRVEGNPLSFEHEKWTRKP